MKKWIAVLIALTVAVIFAVPAAADQGSVIVANAGVPYLSAQGFKGGVQLISSIQAPADNGLIYSAVRIQSGFEDDPFNHPTGLVQIGWVRSKGPITYQDYGGCIGLGNQARGYYIEWKHVGPLSEHPFQCAYFPTSASQWGKQATFEVRNMSPGSQSWQVLKDGQVKVSGLFLGFDYGIPMFAAEFPGHPVAEEQPSNPPPCAMHAYYGNSGQPNNRPQDVPQLKPYSPDGTAPYQGIPDMDLNLDPLPDVAGGIWSGGIAGGVGSEEGGDVQFPNIQYERWGSPQPPAWSTPHCSTGDWTL